MLNTDSGCTLVSVSVLNYSVAVSKFCKLEHVACASVTLSTKKIVVAFVFQLVSLTEAKNKIERLQHQLENAEALVNLKADYEK